MEGLLLSVSGRDAGLPAWRQTVALLWGGPEECVDCSSCCGSLHLFLQWVFCGCSGRSPSVPRAGLRAGARAVAKRPKLNSQRKLISKYKMALLVDLAGK